jgi:hypothetical protein
LRLKQYSARTEKTYILWVKSYILFHNKRHPKDMGVPEIRQFHHAPSTRSGQIYTHALQRGGLAAACVPEAQRSGIKSPLDA